MRADMQNMFMRIHMLYDAGQGDLHVVDTLRVLESRGYRIGEREVKLELERLAADNFLSLHDDVYSITGAGLSELKEIQIMLMEMCTAQIFPISEK